MMKEANSAVETRPMVVTHTHTAVRAIALLLVCVVMTGLTATAQVEWKDRYVTLASGDQKNPSIAQPPGGGYTVIVWEDYRNGSSDIYAQRIENGNGIATWFPIDGVPVCTAAGEQRNPRAAFDGDGNVIICWEDYRNDLSTPFDPGVNRPEVWATKILFDDGTEDVTWSGGRRIDGDIAYRSYRPRIAGTVDGAFITWTTTRDVNVDVYMQYMLSSTASWPAVGSWIAKGIRVNVDDQDYAQNSEIVVDSIRTVSAGRCGAVIAFEGYTNKWQIRMSRFDSLGNNIWASDMIIAPDTFDTRQQNVKIAHAGLQPFGGGTSMMVVCTWEDWRYRLTTDYDVYAQMVELVNGESQWPSTTFPEGLRITNAVNRQLNPDLVIKDGKAVIAWEDYRDHIGTGVDIYANMVTLSSQSLVSAGGVSVCSESGDQRHFCMSGNAEGGSMWIGWEDWRSGGADVYYQKYYWSTFASALVQNGWPVTVSKGDQTEVVMGEKAFVYTDSRRQSISYDHQTDLNIYAQIPGDECDGPTNMHWKDELAKWTLYSDARDHRFAVDGDGNTYVVWYEIRADQSGDGTPGIYAQKLDMDGVPRWQNDGVLLSQDSDVGLPDVCPSVSGSGVFVWREQQGIQIAEVDASGSIAWRNSGTCPSGDCDQPRVVKTGSNIYAAYKDGTNAIQADIYNTSGTLTGGGAVLYGNAGVLYPKVCTDYVDGCYVVAVDGNGLSLRYAHINALSAVNTGTPFSIQNGWFNSYDIAADPLTWMTGKPNQAVVAFTDCAYAYVFKIKSAWNLVSRYPYTQRNGIISSGSGFHQSVCVAADNIPNAVDTLGGGALVAWDHTEYVQSLQDSSHITQTQRAIWQNAIGSVLHQWTDPLNLVNYTYTQTEDTKPDIVWRGNEDSEHIYGVVAWQDNRYPWCTSNAAIIGQSVNYAEPDPALATLWDADGEEISPQIGNVRQSCVQIERCPSEADIAMVSGYWLDTRAGSPIVAGTMLDDVITGSVHSMVIKKENTGERSVPMAGTMHLDQSYPNPLSTSSGSAVKIGFTIARDGMCSVLLYDALGRKVATLTDGWREAGSYNVVVPYSVTSYLPAGMYRYELRLGSESVSRMMVVVH